MNPILPVDNVSIEDQLNNISGVSGSTIVCSSVYQVVLVNQVSDFTDNFLPVSSSAFCIMVIAAFFYHKFLCVVKTIINSFFKEAVSKYGK